MAPQTFASFSNLLLSTCERKFIAEGIKNDCRLDGRQRLAFRSLQRISASGNGTTKVKSIQVNPMPHKWASSRIKSYASDGGHWDIQCAVSAELKSLPVEEPRLQCFIDKSGERDDKYLEWASLLQELLEPLVFNSSQRKSLTPASNLGWCFIIDFQILSQEPEGNLLDVCYVAVRYALSSLHLPTIRLTGDNLLSLVEGSGPIAGQVGPDDMETVEIAEPTGDTSAVVIDYELVDGETSTPIDVGICLTFCQIDDMLVLDPLSEELACSTATLHLIVSSDGQQILCMRKEGRGAIGGGLTLLRECLQVARRIAPIRVRDCDGEVYETE